MRVPPCALLLSSCALPALAVVIRATHNAALPAQGSRPMLQGHPITASYVASANSSGILENVPGRYVATIQLNGRDFRVAIDTGSSDLWVVTPPDFSYNTSSPEQVEIQYGGGPVSGTVGFATMQLGDYSFSQQAFINATDVGLGGIVDVGLDGLMGLAFDGEASDVTEVLYYSLGSTVGQPFLFNVFDQTPNQDNFIGIALSRTNDLEGSADASFTINEIDPSYAAIQNVAPVPLFPGGNERWSLLVDSISVDGTNIPLTSGVQNTSAGSLVAVMDTGTPTATLPPDILYALYSSIPGALVEVGGGNMVFIIPCNTSAIVTVSLAGVSYPIHPLDLSDIYPNVLTDDNGNNVTVCVSTISGLPGESDFDALFGDTIMRNIYTLFNFGDAVAKSPTGAASMQLLSVTDATTAVQDVQNVRMAQLAHLPPESTSIPYGFVPATPGSSLPTDTTSGSADAAAAIADSTSPGAGTTTTGGSPMQTYALAIIGLLSASLLLLLVLVAINVRVYLSAGETKKAARADGGKYAPLTLPQKFRDDEPLDGERYDVGKQYSD